MTSCLVKSAEVSIAQKQMAQALAFLEVFSIKAVAGFLEQASEYMLAGACLVASQHREESRRTESAR